MHWQTKPLSDMNLSIARSLTNFESPIFPQVACQNCSVEVCVQAFRQARMAHPHKMRTDVAKKSQIHRQKKRELLVQKYAEKRSMLKRQAKDQSLSQEERQQAQLELSQLPRNASPVRLSSRCMVTGRSRGVYREFRLSRITFREMALEGKLPGIKKASW